MFTETPLPQNIMTEWIVHPVMHAAAAIVKSIGSTYAGWGYDLGRRAFWERCPFSPIWRTRLGSRKGQRV